MPKEIIMAMAVIKKAAARVNSKMNGLEGEIAQAIEKAADEVKPRAVP
jgi:fumarate hydratase class II